jgi:hypothetical protein
MSDTKDETETKEPYTPPKSSWRLTTFIEAPMDEIKAKIVDCKTCPVFLLCEAGQGGTGWTCMKCRSTGVYVDTPEGNGKLPDDALILDCTKHKFEMRKEAEQIPSCSLCNGGMMELEVINITEGDKKVPYTKSHYIATVHAGMKVEERQKALKDYFAQHMKEYGGEKEKKKSGSR